MALWDCPPVFKNDASFTGNADDYLWLLTMRLFQQLRWRLTEFLVTGYSLAGLFALYTIYQTDLFSRVGSMSGSLWFPGMKECIFTHEPKRWPDCMYFSLGNKESKTRPPMLRSVRQNTEEIRPPYQSKGSDTVFHLNPSNHYPPFRTYNYWALLDAKYSSFNVVLILISKCESSWTDIHSICHG